MSRLKNDPRIRFAVGAAAAVLVISIAVLLTCLCRGPAPVKDQGSVAGEVSGAAVIKSKYDTIRNSFALDHSGDVTVSFKAPAAAERFLYYGSVYSRLDVYLNNSPVRDKDLFSVNRTDQPRQLASPADDTIDVKMVYSASERINALTMQDLISALHNMMIRWLLDHYGAGAFAAMLFMALGVFLCSKAVYTLQPDYFGKLVMYSGLFVMSLGIMQLGDGFGISPIIRYSGLAVLSIPIYRAAEVYPMKLWGRDRLAYFVALAVTLMAVLLLRLGTFGIPWAAALTLAVLIYRHRTKTRKIKADSIL